MRTLHSPTARWLLGFVLALACTVPATAQVIRCVDPASGKVTYTDERCAQGETTREVEPRKSAQEIEQERDQADQALQRKYERQRAEAELQRTAPPDHASTPRGRTAAPDPAQSLQCQRARQNLQTVLSSADATVYDDQARIAAAQRQADLACLSPAEYARLQNRPSHAERYPPGMVIPPVVVVPPPRPHRPEPKREITQCNVFRCYDKNGNSYPR